MLFAKNRTKSKELNMRTIEATGKNVEEAVQEGLKKLNLTKADVDIKIISKGGWFSKAKVAITDTRSESEIVAQNNIENVTKMQKNTKNSQKNSKNDDKMSKNRQNNEKTTQKTNEHQVVLNSTFASHRILEAQKDTQNSQKIEVKELNQTKINLIKNFLTGFFNKINVTAAMNIEEDDKTITINITSDNANILIGHRGETLQAIQSMINAILSFKNLKGKKLVVDVEGYRKSQQKKIEEKAKNAIEKCITTAKPVSLDYMNPYERFIVHEVVMADGRVTSESFGKEPRRFVKIFIK